MGSGISGGYSNTKGASSSSEALVKQLEQSGVKFSKNDMVFVTKDKTGQVVWLEKGNESSGLQHIVSRHADDFQSKHGVSKSQISNHLSDVFTSGKVEYSRITQKNGRAGYERLYSYNGKYYLQTGVGTNGYIVSAYPISKEVAIKLIERYR